MRPITIFLMLFCTSVAAQPGKKYVSMSNPSEMFYGFCDLHKCRTIDSTRLIVTYNLSSVEDTLGGRRYDNKMILQIGTKYTKYYSLLKFLNDELFTMQIHGQQPTEEFFSLQESSGKGGEATSCIIFRNSTEARMKVVRFIPFSNDRTIYYEEPTPRIEWKIGEETDTLHSYVCRKAEADFRGRHYEVWFSTEIPMDAGPWKFSGLPGLILSVKESGSSFIWECIGIEAKKEPIVEHMIPAQQYSREQYMKFERAYHLSPQTILSQGGTIVFKYWDKATKTSRELDSSWTLPYNPLELE